MYYNGEDPLIHYGVLGMKWGVRKDGRPQGFQYGEQGRASKTARKAKQLWKKARGTDYTPSEEHKKSRDIAKKKLPEMSNKELKDFNERIRLEAEYKRITKKGKGSAHTILKILGAGAIKDGYSALSPIAQSVLKAKGKDGAADILSMVGDTVVKVATDEMIRTAQSKKK